jgi:xanthine dehydrogenase accessory factor
VKIFLDVIKPDPRLIIIGSGHIAKPLADYAYRIGFKVVVVDDAKTATPERFPTAEIHTGPFEDEIEKVEIRPSDFVAIVHGETGIELTALRSVLGKKPAYIGLLGSSHKASEHKGQLLAEGFKSSLVEAIRAPIGLDIGAETPEEIAVSIVAELIQMKRD